MVFQIMMRKFHTKNYNLKNPEHCVKQISAICGFKTNAINRAIPVAIIVETLIFGKYSIS